MNERRDMKHLIGVQVADDGEMFCLKDIIDELEEFVDQFSTHAMSDHVLYLKGQKYAYDDVLDYLKRLARIDEDDD